MKALKILLGVFALYVLVVVAFETWLGIAQPGGDSGGTMVITTIDENGVAKPRVVSRIEVDDKLYVGVNHWPRSWYGHLLERPAVKVTRDGVTADYIAHAVEGAEHDAVAAARPASLTFRLLTGFPPRRFVRFDPAT